MGDTGSLALGGLIGYIAIVIRQELMLLLVGGIFVARSPLGHHAGQLLQIHQKPLRPRPADLPLSPLHHHFQRKGWTETQVVVRFWLVGAMLAAMALATIKLR